MPGREGDRLMSPSSIGVRCDGPRCADYLASGAALFFFLQAEDGMRYVAVTGVQTCALPILITSGSVVIQQATQRGMTTDPDVIILTPNATMTAVYYNSDGWSGGSRCATQGNVLFNAPIPGNFVVQGAGPNNPDGTTPNYATAILMPDGHSLTQGQPFARCTADGSATMWWSISNDLYGTGVEGGHGGSKLSSIGGTIRLAELVPGGVIRHVMKVNLYGLYNYYYDASSHGYRWPASQADSCASTCYGGTASALRMGSLLAIPASVNIDGLGLETEPAKILARAFQHYGAYAVGDTAWSSYAIETEFGPH